MKLIRILLNNLRDSFKSIARNISLSIASITNSAITLIIVGIALVMSLNVNNATNELQNDLTIEVFLNQNLEQSQIDSIENQIIELDNVKEKNVVYISNEDWKAELKADSEELSAILDTLEENPLLNSFEVKVDDVEDLKKTSKEIQTIEGVYETKYGEGKAEQYINAFNVLETFTIVVVISLIIVTIFLISNTIKLTIFSRKKEIEIMRLVGTSNTIIKMPFLFEGLILGIFGSLIPISIIIYGYITLYEKLGGYIYSNIIPLVNPFPFVFIVSGILVTIGGVIGMFGSASAVRKYLKI